uniref:AB hydrolase-1 domain-containing protein n=1 Tax=Chromera velia CCMP2878 TaxID=1169474 RepID=A0A0G4IFI9_9ALVE|mmetsp:Transcript_47742/g.94217  ORF Transcript_47742/g.94217 Transcript_47742/m.94217 type:complete len:363 (-) Transcript_47742:123-1211(-)|eukprot:Cvel_13926.t1-p1 / transcript=Cvel_13926.t1 / gene=Cvel_13926 / organism=Chromera_velia_CCMP2878 / gene_product=Proline iminopeptidase, putative / transcript_product=Proline iminopeptidase, putative / location=Cvel_scaffold971:24427-28701(-) / protein_length=362 / sequence_SO=supercontig / SO=protein_coding / is_pseudo=false
MVKVPFLAGAAALAVSAAAFPLPSGPNGTLTCDDVTPDLCSDLVYTSHSMAVKGFTLKYWKYSSTKTDHTNPTLVGIHGGPGGDHQYLLPLKQLACRGFPVILYDQVGAGESDRPTEKEAPWLYTLDYYVEELGDLVGHAGLSSFFVLGHSWGGVVAQLYAIQRHDDKRMKALVLASIFSDPDVYVKGQWDYRLNTLPEVTQAILKDADRKKEYDSPAYQAVNAQLTGFFTIRTSPMPDCVQWSLGHINEDIYVKMQGASEFTVGGALAKFNTTEKLKEFVRVPTLITGGEFDTMTPPVLDLLHNSIPGSQLTVFPTSAHMTTIDAAGPMNDRLEEFFNDVLSGKLHKATEADQRQAELRRM